MDSMQTLFISSNEIKVKNVFNFMNRNTSSENVCLAVYASPMKIVSKTY